MQHRNLQLNVHHKRHERLAVQMKNADRKKALGSRLWSNPMRFHCKLVSKLDLILTFPLDAISFILLASVGVSAVERMRSSASEQC